MPKTPDEFAAALFVIIVLGALVTVALGRLVVWIASAVEQARSVKGSAEGRADYVAPKPVVNVSAITAFSPFEQPEQPRPVQPEQDRTDGDDGGLSIRDYETLDKLGALLASKALASEAAAIETFFPPVKRGGSRRYIQLRDALRAAATRQGWKPQAPPDTPPPRVVQIAGGREGQFEL
jgi:hypothetical protein